MNKTITDILFNRSGFENDFVKTVTNVRKQIYDEYQEGDIYYMKIKVRK